jgi:hypothetical protein
MEEWTGLIGSVGFPIAVTMFLLIERGKTLKELTGAINNLTLLIQSKIK